MNINHIQTTTPSQTEISTYLDHAIPRWCGHFLPEFLHQTWLHEFLIFGAKMARSALYGGMLLTMILVSSCFEFSWMARYDMLFVGAILIQMTLLVLKIESWRETRTILIFHVVATIMELFKTHPEIGSWQYPEACFFKIGNVPLFTGFMYSAVGSFIARSWKVMGLTYNHFPKKQYIVPLAVLIYLNFFTHHFVLDIRNALFVLTAMLFFKTQVRFFVYQKERRMPMLLAFFLISFFLWIAENIGTYGNVWLYPGQVDTWHLVSFHKMGAWYLLMIVSFVLVALEKRR